MLRWTLAACPLVLLASCYSPQVEDGLACSPNLECPPSQSCEPATHFCYADGTMGVGTPTRLDWFMYPTTVVATHPMAQVRVRIVDQRDHRILNTNAPITIALGTVGGGGALHGTTMRPSVEGEAIFDDLTIDAIGSYTLTASTAGLSDLPSTAIEVVAFAFQDERIQATGNYPRWAAIADFTGDGKLDVATANTGEGSLSMLKGDGDGGLAMAKTTVVGEEPHALAAGDLNNDGLVDLATSLRIDGVESVGMYFNLGDGTFNNSVVFKNGVRTESVAIADIDMDGSNDVLVANGTTGFIDIYYNNAVGVVQFPTFTIVSLDCRGMGPNTILVRDIDGDSLPDAVTSGGNGLCVVRRDPSQPRAFRTPQLNMPMGANTFFQFMALGDISGDGKPDVLTYEYNAMGFQKWLQGAAGTFGAPSSLLSAAGQVGAIDTASIDGDGSDDLLVVDESQTVRVQLQTSPAQFMPFELLVTGSARWVAGADMTGDGITDVVVTDDDNVSIFVGL